jgi:hypothetical protein
MSLGARDLLTYLAARVLPALAGMATTALCVQMLSAEHYALYSLSALPALLASGFVGGVAAQALMRHALQLSPRAVRQGLYAVPLLGALLALPVVLACLVWQGASVTAALPVGALWAWALAAVPLGALIDARRGWFVAHGQPRATLALDTLRSALALGLCAAFLVGLSSHPAAPLAAHVLATLAALLVVRGAPGALRAGASAGGQREVDATYLGHGLGVATWLAIATGLALAERTVVVSSIDLAEGGRYAARADVINAIYAAVGGALGAATMPAYLRSIAEGGRAAQDRLLAFALRMLVLAAALCLVAGLAFAALEGPLGRSRFVTLFTGDTATALVLLGAALVWTAAGFVQKPLELGGRTPRVVLAILVAFGLFIVVAPMLAARFGAAGVAAAKLLAGLAFVAGILVAQRNLR